MRRAPAHGRDSHALIEGSGSSWAANAVNQWVADVASEGIQVVYTPDGDAQGRQDFANRTSDFAVTADGYQGSTRSPASPTPRRAGRMPTCRSRRAARRSPIRSGSTASRCENLRLSGETLAKIFTNQITNWDDPEITQDNNGHALPSLPIIPVVQAEGSGATDQLTNYFATEFPSIWHALRRPVGVRPSTSRARATRSPRTARTRAMNYVSSSAGERRRSATSSTRSP